VSWWGKVKKNTNLNFKIENHYKNCINVTTALTPNDGRFEGFKSAGKIGNIENKELQNDIMDLYQENIPALLNSSKGCISLKMNFLNYLIQNQKRITDSATNREEILKQDMVFDFATVLRHPAEVLSRYDLCIQLMQKIIAEIDEEYK